MEDQLISFETAKLAKEKRFEIDKYLSIDDENPKNLNSNFNPREYQPWYFNLTQSLLQRWLREVHNIYVESYHDLTSDGKSIHFCTSWGFLQSKDINGNQNVNGWYDEYGDWRTYEQALEAGLQQSLQLIK